MKASPWDNGSKEPCPRTQRSGHGRIRTEDRLIRCEALALRDALTGRKKFSGWAENVSGRKKEFRLLIFCFLPSHSLIIDSPLAPANDFFPFQRFDPDCPCLCQEILENKDEFSSLRSQSVYRWQAMVSGRYLGWTGGDGWTTNVFFLQDINVAEKNARSQRKSITLCHQFDDQTRRPTATLVLWIRTWFCLFLYFLCQFLHFSFSPCACVNPISSFLLLPLLLVYRTWHRCTDASVPVCNPSPFSVRMRQSDPFTSSTSPLTCFTVPGTGAPMPVVSVPVCNSFPPHPVLCFAEEVHEGETSCSIKSFFSGLFWMQMMI